MSKVKDSQITRFGLMRHARTVWNQEKRIQGQKDSPVTREGRKQAAECGKILKSLSWHRILSSDTGRAVETANIINTYLQMSILKDHRLREQNWGQWTGKTLDSIGNQSSQELAARGGTGWRFCPPDGEDRLTVWQRSQQALVDIAEKHPRENILVVTHEGVIKCLVYRLYGRRFLPSEPQIIQPYHLHWISYDDHRLKVEALNALALF
jgi:probable phosphoglycerate mutase